MTTLAELERKINNIYQIGTINEVYTTQRPKDHDDYALFAKVDVMGRTTDFFPVMAQIGEFKKHYRPPYVGEQVMVMCPFGNANVGYIVRGLFSNNKEPVTHSVKDRTIEYIEYKG
jgi:phage baseplate assembly protein V